MIDEIVKKEKKIRRRKKVIVTGDENEQTMKECSPKPPAKKRTKLSLKEGKEERKLETMFQNSAKKTANPSVLQVLCYTPGFMTQLTILKKEIAATEEEIKKLEQGEPSDSRDMVRYIHQLFSNMENREELYSNKKTKYLALRPYSIIHELQKINPVFVEGEQQDAHEFLQCILGCLQESVKEINTLRERLTVTVSANTKPPTESPPDEAPSKRAKKLTKMSDTSLNALKQMALNSRLSVDVTPLDIPSMKPIRDPIPSLFEGSMALCTQCLECESSTERKDMYQSIGLPVNHPMDPELNENDWVRNAIREEEFLRGDNKYKCEECLRLVEAKRSLRYISVPQILTLHQLRFAVYSGEVLSKLSQVRPIPFTLPCLLDKCPPSCSEHQMHLYAVIKHCGASLLSGHYSAYVKIPQHKIKALEEARHLYYPWETAEENAEPLVWLHLDDDQADVLTLKEIKHALAFSESSTPYLLFYC
ncbi:hypothetical protein CAPTEDRAFT_225994 [Capitella teleta]|uniref:USP domain-containing protein n=1 Tax=Capitella teleta TaxID=283909 RepID=R7UDK8_CAPTE|nr:hypothetical protein CAPTEDRAFT_225994 [Capitella teleta]|eukprot:ELU04196.1 hypothetical protein CAPTEDRAFT_225994 [Capitella teleta]